jgi:hypothetical protein
VGHCCCVLRRTAELDDRQIRSAVDECHVQHELVTEVSGNRRLRLRAGRTARLLCARLDTRPMVVGEPLEVDCIGSPPAERHVGTMFVVPTGHAQHGLAHRLTPEEYEKTFQPLVLQRLDEPPDHLDRPDAYKQSPGESPREECPKRARHFVNQRQTVPCSVIAVPQIAPQPFGTFRTSRDPSFRLRRIAVGLESSRLFAAESLTKVPGQGLRAERSFLRIAI